MRGCSEQCVQKTFADSLMNGVSDACVIPQGLCGIDVTKLTDLLFGGGWRMGGGEGGGVLSWRCLAGPRESRFDSVRLVLLVF